MKEMVTEMCSYCERENTFEWDVETEGYLAYCQHCGKELMLCGVCMSEDTKCDWCEAGCYRKAEVTETHNVRCQFVSHGVVTEKEYPVVLVTDEDREAFESAMEGESSEHCFQPFMVKPNNIVPSTGYRPILNNGADGMAVRCTDGWLVVTASSTKDQYHSVDVEFQPDVPSEGEFTLSAYIEEEVEKGELSVRVWSDPNSEEYTHKIILRENKNETV